MSPVGAGDAGVPAGSVHAVGSRGAALQVLGDQVGFVVLGEVVAAHEAFLALRALEAFVTCGGQRGQRVALPWGHRHPHTGVPVVLNPARTGQRGPPGWQVPFAPAPLCDTSVPSVTQGCRDPPTLSSPSQ